MTNMMVYGLYDAGSGLTKIGYSSNPPQRLRDLQTGMPTKLSLVGSSPGGRSVEAQLHAALKDRHARGEWFSLGDDPWPIVEETIRALAFAPVTQATVDTNVGAAVKARRNALGLSQEGLAELAGIRRATLSDLERGGDALFSTVVAVLGALNLSLQMYASP